ncbi:hypothetical protein Tco_0488346 [Tanacetum coccineum]
MVLSLLSQMPPTSKSSTPPTIKESFAKLGDLIDKLELVTKRLVMKRLATSTANLVSVTTKATTVILSITITESSDDTTNNTHHPTTNNHDMTIPNTDTKASGEQEGVVEVRLQKGIILISGFRIMNGDFHSNNVKMDDAKKRKSGKDEMISLTEEQNSKVGIAHRSIKVIDERR